MGVSIIIVNYNTKDLLVSCIESIRKYCLRTPYEIIVVDNASTDDSVNELLKVDPNVVLISNLENKVLVQLIIKEFVLLCMIIFSY